LDTESKPLSEQCPAVNLNEDNLLTTRGAHGVAMSSVAWRLRLWAHLEGEGNVRLGVEIVDAIFGRPGDAILKLNVAPKVDSDPVP
jgi:hypothetical protein